MTALRGCYVGSKPRMLLGRLELIADVIWLKVAVREDLEMRKVWKCWLWVSDFPAVLERSLLWYSGHATLFQMVWKFLTLLKPL